ncbi:response regulator [Paucibacter sp. B2R-40]|uniref:response regulator n=1 Tax=Paucibacter sp. B2R-40 TaxID=2893554 RepID=UPI0021E43A7B|nr:response regulator [Paucibacter sp. B2R-40]MCV2354955.1 response regulator [Paucibacter sp. B2R-40]
MQTATHAPLRVLIVDDSRAIQAIIQRVLQTAGLGPLLIELAMDGEQALRLVSAFEPDLVISDWHMPKIGGLELLQTLRQIGRHEIKVGFVTTETATRHLDQARSNGALFVINKPFKDEDLLREVKSALAPRLAELQAPPGPAPALVSVEALSGLIKSFLHDIPFRLIAAPGQQMSDLKLPHNLAMYVAAGHKTPHALGVLDVNCCCILGGGGAQMQPAPVRAAMQVGAPTAEMMKFADQFMHSAAGLLVKSKDSPEVGLKVANLMSKPFEKMGTLMARGHGRSDYRLSVPGYGEGRLAFVLI